MIQPPLARDPARGDWRARPEAQDGPAGPPPRDDGPEADVLSRERPATGPRSGTGQLPAASQADGPEPQALSRERLAAEVRSVTG